MTPVAVETGFPVDVLDGCETALVVFAAAFGGEQDAKFIRDAGLVDVECVDIDSEALGKMLRDYPEDWVFTPGDAFEFLDLQLEEGWPPDDVVTLDPWHGNLMDATIERLADFAKLARRYVIVGVDGRRIDPPAGWRVRSKYWRSANRGGTWWAVLERA